MEIFTVNAFTSVPFAGNPAGVVVMDHDADTAWMQHVAAEINLPETAFVERRGQSWSLRWFSPTVEVELCGHATLATAHVLFTLHGERSPLTFETRSGILGAARSESGISLDFPLDVPVATAIPAGITDVLGAMTCSVATGRFGFLVELENPKIVRELQPNIGAMLAIRFPSIIVTAQGGDEADFTSRVFAPAFGIDEDSVTGSAHCMLAPFWRDRLGRDELVGYQASSRGGFVGVRVRDTRVELMGNAVTILKGELQI